MCNANWWTHTESQAFTSEGDRASRTSPVTPACKYPFPVSTAFVTSTSANWTVRQVRGKRHVCANDMFDLQELQVLGSNQTEYSHLCVPLHHKSCLLIQYNMVTVPLPSQTARVIIESRASAFIRCGESQAAARPSRLPLEPSP